MNQNEKKPGRLTLKDQQQESALFRTRAGVAGGIVLVAFGILLLRYFWLQVVQHQTYSTLSESNRIRLEAISPPRGFIYDRNGILLADNRPVFALVVNRQYAGNIDDMLKRLAPVLGLTDDEVASFRTHLRISRRYDTVPLRSRMSEEDMARFSEVRYAFPGVETEIESSRYYPYGELFSHVLGYVSRISESELEKQDPSIYDGTSLIGKIGLEKYYEKELHGRPGYEQVETDAHGKRIRLLKRIPPVRGTDLRLYLDAHMQQIAVEQLAGRRGAIVAIDPRSGGVRAFVSNPGFDPNLFVGGIPGVIYRGLSENPDRPLYNRALQGIYPPGSTIKPFEGMGGLNYGVIDWNFKVSDPGFFTLPGDTHRFRDWKKGGHGIVDLARAIEQSCDVFFYTLADRLGVDRFHDWMEQFGFGSKTGIDLVNEKSGSLPSVAWKRKHLRAPWYRGEMMSVGIGQGYFTVTPLQLALATAIMANEGHLLRPQLVQSSRGPMPVEIAPQPDGQVKFNGTAQDWELMHQAMRNVIFGAGTATALRRNLVGYDMAGKTGTAQVKGIKQNEKYDASKQDSRFWDHAWFIAFAPVDHPVLAVAVLVENGKHGGSAAAPIAKALFDYEINGTIAPAPKLEGEDDSTE